MFSTLRDWSAAWSAPSTAWGGGWRPAVTTSTDDPESSGSSSSSESEEDDDAPSRKARKRETKSRQVRFGYTTDATGEGGGGAAAFQFTPSDSSWYKLYLSNPELSDESSPIAQVRDFFYCLYQPS